MEFTYSAYRNLLNLIKKSGYGFYNYHNYKAAERTVILRHDIDYHLEYALPFAKLERECGAQAVYFVEISSEFYNVFSKSNEKLLHSILEYGHIIGLHFDRTKYPDNVDCAEKVIEEVEILQKAIGEKVDCFSFHEPLKSDLGCDLPPLSHIANAYGSEFFYGFKYYSDSVMNWREDVEAGVRGQEYEKLQILTHPFWYAETQSDVASVLKRFICKGTADRYHLTSKVCGYLDKYIDEKDIIKNEA